jgi:hypothetical protein
MSWQEKFQITVPYKEEAAENENWVFPIDSGEKLRDANDGWHKNNVGAADEDGMKFNFLPPGQDICNQEYKKIENMPLSMAGASDVSGKLVNKTAFSLDRDKGGFTKIEMKGTDDQYTGEHVDHFYGDSGGFAERNNYLDRM